MKGIIKFIQVEDIIIREEGNYINNSIVNKLIIDTEDHHLNLIKVHPKIVLKVDQARNLRN